MKRSNGLSFLDSATATSTIPTWQPRLIPLMPRRENSRTVCGDRDGELEVRRERAVFGVNGPAVVAHADERPAGIDHRLDREHRSLLQQRSLAGVPVVRDLRLLVHLTPDPMTDQSADNREPLDLDGPLDRRRDVTQPLAGAHLFDP